MARKRQAEEVPDDNTYLVCPLSDDEVEAIRAKAYKSREENSTQKHKKARQSTSDVLSELKERRRLREAGELVPDSGISCVDDLKEFREFAEAYDDPLLYTQFVRREFYWQLNREQMQRAVTRYFGWDKWSENPWGSYPKFCEWISNIPDNEMAVWAVNETSMGRDYLVRSILEGIAQLKYSEMTEKDLLVQIGYGAACFLHTKNYTGWDNFLNHYPGEPLPVVLVNEKVGKVYPFDFILPYSGMTFPLPQKPDGSLDIPRRVPEKPFEEIEDFLSLFIDARNYGPLTRYRFLVSGIYLWYLALDGAREKAKGHPVLEGFLCYDAATDKHIAELCQKLAPKGYCFPDVNEAWGKLEEAVQKGLDRIDKQYGAKLIVSPVTAQGALFAIVNAIVNAKVSKAKVSNPYQATVAGLKGWLGNTLLRAVENDLIDAVRKEKPSGRKMAEILKGKSKLEPEQEGIDYISVEEEQAALKHLAYELDLQRGRTFGSIDEEFSEVEQDDVTRLRNLGLNLDKLPPSQCSAILRYFQIFKEGGSLDSKRGDSPKEFLGDDYEKVKQAFNRARKNINTP